MRKGTATLLVALVGLTGCGADEPASEPEPVPVALTRVELPVQVVPQVLATSEDALVVGVRGEDQPGLLWWRGAAGPVPVAATPAEPYGRQASWQSLAVVGDRVVGLGGKRGGAHGNVRWSVWAGSPTGVAQQLQAFTTFGGLGAGHLVDAVLTPSGPVVVGTWQGERGLDLTVWVESDAVWSRQDSTGTPLANQRGSLKFPMAATSLGQGVAVAGWELADGGEQRAVVWRSTAGIDGWRAAVLPEDGESATATAIRCWAAECAVSGRVDGSLAVWHLTEDRWERLPGLPNIPVADDETFPPPVPVDEDLLAVAGTSLLRTTADGWVEHPLTGPRNPITDLAIADGTLYALADEELWQIDVNQLPT